MEELIKTFHVDAKLIIAQLVNFAIVLFVLKKFAYAPLLKLMEERTVKIEKGLQDAEMAQQKLTEISEKEKTVLLEAKKQAQEILNKAEAAAERNKEEVIVMAKEQAERILLDAEKKISQEKEQMFCEVKGQVAELVMLATNKLIDEKLDSEKDQELIAKAIK